MAKQFIVTTSLTAETDSGATTLKTEVAALVTARTSEIMSGGRTTTSGTPSTNTAVPLGSVADGEMLFAIANPSTTTGEDIDVSLDYSGTKRVIFRVKAGECFAVRILSAPYVKSTTASLAYDFLCAEI